MSGGPPLTRAYYGDDTIGNDAEAALAAACGWVLDELVYAILHYPWRLEVREDMPIHVRDIAHDQGKSARIAFAAGTVSGMLELAADASGWVLITAAVDGAEVFRGYADLPYEQIDIWPPGAQFDEKRYAEAPGRIGKRRNWINLSAMIWPGLKPVANEYGSANIRVPE